jgi:GT2 family glycosyltransferase
MTATPPAGSLPDCTIVVPTRNRADELATTVAHLVRVGLGATPVIVVDDASDDPAATRAAVRGLTNAVVHVQRRRTGQAEARNLGLAEARTSLCLFFDDDAHLEAAPPLLRFLAELPADPRIALWRFETLRAYDGYRDGLPEGLPAMPLHTFIGFGALMRRDAVRSVGGYRGFLRYRHEEEDLALRLFRAGLRIHYRPGVRFIHRHTPVARDNAEYEFLSARNILLLYAMNWPWPLGLAMGVAKAGSVVLRRRKHPAATLGGLFDGLRTLMRRMAERTPLTYRQLAGYRALRHGVEAAAARIAARAGGPPA